MPAANTPSQNLLFLVAGDSTAAALTALELARQGVPAKLVAAPGSTAASIAMSFGIALEPGSFSLFLGRVGLAEATHLVLFPSDLGELVLWLAAGEDAVDQKPRRTPIGVFAAAPNAEGVSVFGPADAPLALVRGMRRKRFLVRADRGVDLQAFLAAWRARVKVPGSIRLTIDVDPYSFL